MDRWQTSLRFNLLNEDEKKAYEILQGVPKNHRNRFVINAILNASEQITLEEISHDVKQIFMLLDKEGTSDEMGVGFELKI